MTLIALYALGAVSLHALRVVELGRYIYEGLKVPNIIHSEHRSGMWASRSLARKVKLRLDRLPDIDSASTPSKACSSGVRSFVSHLVLLHYHRDCTLPGREGQCPRGDQDSVCQQRLYRFAKSWTNLRLARNHWITSTSICRCPAEINS